MKKTKKAKPMPKGKDWGLTSGGMTQPKKPAKHMATKASLKKMMKNTAPKH